MQETAFADLRKIIRRDIPGNEVKIVLTPDTYTSTIEGKIPKDSDGFLQLDKNHSVDIVRNNLSIRHLSEKCSVTLS